MKRNIAELIRYLLAGLVNTLIGYGMFLFMLHAFQLNPLISNAIAYAVGIIVAYVLNIVFVFEHGTHSTAAFVRFIFGFALAYALNLAMLSFLLKHVLLQPELAQLVAMAVYTISFYLYNKFLTWSA
jgi:putative flippase GtrA